jgi:hypothetical protein
MGNMVENWELAREAVRRALAAKQWTVARLAREGGADPGTLGTFLSGTRSPQTSTQGKIEEALGWPPGTLRDIARQGESAAPAHDQPGTPGRTLSVVPERVQPMEVENAVLRAIEEDPYLLPEAKEHFTNQYALLRRIAQSAEGQGGDPLPYVAHGQRKDPIDPEQEKAIEDVARRASEDNPHSPNGKK